MKQLSNTNINETGEHSSLPTTQYNTKTLPRWLSWFVCKFVGYYNGKFNRFSLDKDNELTLIPVDDKAPLIMIISRDFYQEFTTSYPVESRVELNKLLSLAYPRTEELDTDQHVIQYYHAWGYVDGKNPVNIWKMKENLTSALLQLPETLLLSTLVSNNQVLNLKTDLSSNENESKNSLFVARSGKLIHSLKNSPIINTSKRFASSIGIATTEQDNFIQPNAFAKQLTLAMTKLSLKILPTFIQWPKSANRFQFIKKITVCFTVVFSCYLALSSAYIVIKQQQLQSELASQSAEVSIALKRQQQLDSDLIQYVELEKFFAKQKNMSPFWLVFVDLIPEAMFSDIRIAQERFVLRGQTIKAIDLLELVSQHPLVIDAKFDYPVRKSRGQEIFVISFDVSSGPSVNKVDTEHANAGA